MLAVREEGAGVRGGDHHQAADSQVARRGQLAAHQTATRVRDHVDLENGALGDKTREELRVLLRRHGDAGVVVRRDPAVVLLVQRRHRLARDAAEPAVSGGEGAVHEQQRAPLAEGGPVGVGERRGVALPVAVDGHPAHPGLPVLVLPLAGEVVTYLAQHGVDEGEDEDLQDLLADGADDAAVGVGVLLVGWHDGLGDAVGAPLSPAVGSGRGRNVDGDVPRQRAVLGGVQEDLAVAVARRRHVDLDVVGGAAAARALGRGDLLVLGDDDGELLGEARVAERVVELLGGQLLAAHAGAGRPVDLDDPRKARGADDDVLDEHVAVGTQRFGHGDSSVGGRSAQVVSSAVPWPAAGAGGRRPGRR